MDARGAHQDAVTAARSAVSGLLGEPTGSLRDGRLRSRMGQAQALVAQAEAFRLATLRVLDSRPEAVPGARASQAAAIYLIQRERVSPRQARFDVLVAQHLDPATGALRRLGAALAEGLVSRQHVDVAVRALTRIPQRLLARVGADGRTGTERVDAFVTEQACRFAPCDVQVLARHLVAVVDPDGTRRADKEGYLRRRCSAAFDAFGMLVGNFQLDPEAGATVNLALTTFSAPFPVRTGVTPGGDAVEIRDTREKGQRQADALTAICAIALGHAQAHAKPASARADDGPAATGPLGVVPAEGARPQPAPHQPAPHEPARPEPARPDDVRHQAAQPEPAQPGAAQPGAAQPQAAHPEATAESTPPGATPPEARQSDAPPAGPEPPGPSPLDPARLAAHIAAARIGRVPAHVLINATPEQLAGEPAAGLATDNLSGPISPGTLRRLACDAVLQRVLRSPGGAVLDLGRSVRLATYAQRRAITARDGSCLIPGCGTPVALCDLHHVTSWAAGGRTDLPNIAPLCPRHHTSVHAGEWGLVVLDGLPWAVPPSWVDPRRRPVRNPLGDAVQTALRTGQSLQDRPRLHDPPPYGRAEEPPGRAA
jgi:hypothetical protein